MEAGRGSRSTNRKQKYRMKQRKLRKKRWSIVQVWRDSSRLKTGWFLFILSSRSRLPWSSDLIPLCAQRTILTLEKCFCKQSCATALRYHDEEKQSRSRVFMSCVKLDIVSLYEQHSLRQKYIHGRPRSKWTHVDARLRKQFFLVSCLVKCFTASGSRCSLEDFQMAFLKVLQFHL